MFKDIDHFKARPTSKTRNQKKEQIKDAVWMAGIAACAGLLVLVGMHLGFAMAVSAW